MKGGDHRICIPWPLLVGNFYQYADFAAAEHRLLFLENMNLGDHETADRHIHTVVNIEKWLDCRKRTLLTDALLTAHPLMMERRCFGTLVVRLAGVIGYAEELIFEASALQEELGPPPPAPDDFLFLADGEPAIWVTRRLSMAAWCAGETHNRMVKRQELDRLIQGSSPVPDAQQ